MAIVSGRENGKVGSRLNMWYPNSR